MKNEFAWYLNSSSAMAKDAWSTAILTLDTNVLLDLYRYHSSTRDNILEAIEAFGPRVWISYQAASEFFANRKSVIASSEKTFREAESAIDDLTRSLENGIAKLKGNRLVRRQMLEELGSDLNNSANRARDLIRETSKNYPNYLTVDPILERILDVFDSKIGQNFRDADREALFKDGETRFKLEIPPGYKDEGKDGDKKYGDLGVYPLRIGN